MFIEVIRGLFCGSDSKSCRFQMIFCGGIFSSKFTAICNLCLGAARQAERKKTSVLDGRIDPERDIYAIPSQVGSIGRSLKDDNSEGRDAPDAPFTGYL